jgi:hypothetical protein
MGVAVPIEVEAPRSPGWWLKRQFAKLQDRRRQRRLQELHDRYHGQPPLPEGADAAREVFTAFQRKARSNFAELIVGAVSERMSPVGFRTSADADETGDAQAAEVWQRAGLDVEAADVHDLMLNLGEAYVIVGEVDDETGAPAITAEDPRCMVGTIDPAQPRRLTAALKVLHDDEDAVDRAYLYLPGHIWVASRPSRYPSAHSLAFNPRAWDWDSARSGDLAHDRMPVVRFVNKDGTGEYEGHTDLLDRINHQILQRMVIATMQAFRQRAVSGLPLTDEQTGEEIDYTSVFTMDPAALWQLPETAKMWESGQVDLTPILGAVKDDVQHLAAVTRTPMHMLIPSGVNQSAEGASLEREGLTFKARDRITRTSPRWAQVMSLSFLQLGQPDRADLSKLQTLWAPPENLSLAERADAASKAQNDVPRRSRLIHIWGFSPADADRMMSEWVDEQLLAAQVATATAAATAPPAPTTAPAAVPSVDPLAGMPTDPSTGLPANPVAGLPTSDGSGQGAS